MRNYCIQGTPKTGKASSVSYVMVYHVRHSNPSSVQDVCPMNLV